MKTFLTLTLAAFSFVCSAATFELRGSYYFKKGEKLPVNFRVHWAEKDGELTGFYTDDRLENRAIVSGMMTENGRTFEVVLPRQIGGVKTISILTSVVGGKSTGETIPVQVVTRDVVGNPLTTARLDASFAEVGPRKEAAQAQEEKPCMEGFGEIAGFCGRYGGMISELSDPARQCNFMSYKDIRLELDNEANVIFHTAQPSDRHMTQDHLIGRVPSGHPSRIVDVMSRQCRPLPGTNFPGDDCKRLNLRGTFSLRGGDPHFVGTYEITDERSGRNCRYSMTLDRVERI